ncbi:hypothetical protein CKG00_06375 [Morganella morganii]|uniref:Uncharacterized protein n=1 Tax=Morganella morganii TaxID=582 RepID=A0A433ZVA8_MORMO|nr:hypothetical protein CKG00_06375 [Morganella morganii]
MFLFESHYYTEPVQYCTCACRQNRYRLPSIISELWLNSSQRFDVYFADNADLNGLDTLVTEQKNYFTCFNS